MSNMEGTPVWFELTTPDPDESQDFYRHVAGWTIAPSAMAEHGGYRIATAPDGERIAGLMAPPPGAPSPVGWTVYFGVADVDAAAARVKELGGAVHFGPMDIPHVGRFAAVSDPQGIGFNLLTGADPAGSRAFAAAPGAIGHGVWVELATPDPDGAFAFYGALFGWEKAGAMPMGEMGDYHLAMIGDTMVGGIMEMGGPDFEGVPEHWFSYVEVDEVEPRVALLEQEGGTVVRPPFDVPGVGRIAIIQIPGGAMQGWMKPVPQQG